MLYLLTVPASRSHFVFRVDVVWGESLVAFVLVLGSGSGLDALSSFVCCTWLALKLGSSLVRPSATDPIVALADAEIKTRNAILRAHSLKSL